MTSIFTFGDPRLPSVSFETVTFPDPDSLSLLIARYFDFAVPTYRVLHRPTVEVWFKRVHSLQLSQKAILYTMLAQTTLVNAQSTTGNAGETGEAYFSAAGALLAKEHGQPTLASIQARFLGVLYLLSTARINQAWFQLGIVVQLIVALGFHRISRTQTAHSTSIIDAECRKRILWSAYTVYKYLSVILGRPHLLQAEETDQDLPRSVNDEDLKKDTIQLHARRDCLMEAPRQHIMLAKIVERITKQQYTIKRMRRQDLIDTATALNTEVSHWQQGLPALLSGAIHPSSLIPIFQRQLEVLRLARAHAIMLLNRPLLARNYAKHLSEPYASRYQAAVLACVQAAEDVVELIQSFVLEDQFFPAFWYSQYIAFNAISILYIFVLLHRQSAVGLPSLTWSGDSDLAMANTNGNTFFERVVAGHSHLAQASRNSSGSSHRYHIVLEELREEVKRQISKPTRKEPRAVSDQ